MGMVMNTLLVMVMVMVVMVVMGVVDICGQYGG